MEILYELDKEGILNERLKKTYFSLQTESEKKNFCFELVEKKKLLNHFNSKSKRFSKRKGINLEDIIKNLDLYPLSFFQNMLNSFSVKKDVIKPERKRKKNKKKVELKKKRTLTSKEIKLQKEKNKYEKFASIRIPKNQRIFANYCTISTPTYS